MSNQFWESHLTRAQDENVAFLVESGCSLETACDRAGVSYEAYTKRHERRDAKREKSRSNA